MMKYIVVTGGAGFIGTNLIKTLAVNKKYKIISIDNYFTGSKKNHIKEKNVKYINGNTKNISKILNSIKKKLALYFILQNFQE